jgi:predicted CXXCH cytochrome family protein
MNPVRAAGVVAMLGGLGTTGAWVPLAAQHPPRGPESSSAPGGCRMCHGMHPVGPGSFVLKTGGPSRAAAGAIAHQAPGLSAVSQSCLRCHLTPTLRENQPDVLPRSGETGKYLGVDLSDDHPLGRLDVAVRRSLRPDVQNPRPSVRRDPLDVEEMGVMECTECHDPHDPLTAIPSPAEQREICGDCHDSSQLADPTHWNLSCSNCHRLHGAAQPGLVAERNTDLLCQQCHDSPALLPTHEPGQRPPYSPQMVRREAHESGGSCLGCHPAHD